MESMLLQVSRFWLHRAGGTGSEDGGDPYQEGERGITLGHTHSDVSVVVHKTQHGINVIAGKQGLVAWGWGDTILGGREG